MATIYTKTALKKVKKDELIQMFLDLQAQKVDIMMDEVVEKCCTDAVEEVVEGMKSVIEEVKEENEKLKEENEKLKAEIEKWKYWASEVIYWSHSASKDNLQEKKLITDTNQPTIGDVRDFGEEIRDLKEQLKEPKELFIYKAKVKELREENQVIKGEFIKKKRENENLKKRLVKAGVNQN